MALQPAVLDVSLSTTSQVASDTMGPLGRLQSMRQCQVKRYLPHYAGATGVVPAKIRVEPRDAFNSLPATSRSVVDGSPSTPGWNQQRLLAELDSQLVSICGGSLPRVFDGSNWRTYPNNVVLTQKLSQEVFHTSQRTIQAPDSAWLGGVTCSVWTESTVVATGQLTTTYVGFKADNGAWVVQPTVLFVAAMTSVSGLGKVVSDGSNFFVFFNDGIDVIVNVYSSNGAFLGAAAIALVSAGGTPGLWDVVASPTPSQSATVIFAQSVAFGQNADSGVTLTSVKFTAPSTVTLHSNVDAAMHCSGALQWLTNNSGDGLAYLATGRRFSDAEEDFWVYQVTNLAHTHEYQSNFDIDLDVNTLDSIAGYVGTGSPPTVFLSIGLLPCLASAATHGPQVDPQFRFMTSMSIAGTGGPGHTSLRTTQSLAQSSRAFAIDGNYYTLGYYQSGSGSILIQTDENVTIEAGDYMIGAATQPLTVSTGDLVFGSPITQNVAAGSGGAFVIDKTGTIGATGIGAGNSAVLFTASGMSSAGIPDGTLLLKWTLSGLSVPTGGNAGSRLIVSGSSPNMDGSYDIIDDGNDSPRLATNQVLTPTQTINGVSRSPTTFSAGGTWGVASMTAYFVNDLSVPVYSTDAAALFIAGTIVITNSSGSGNNGTWPIARIRSPLAGFPSPNGTNPSYGLNSGAADSIVWVETTTQTSNSGSFTAVISEVQPNVWTFQNGEFDATYIGADIVVSANPAQPTNVGTFPITAVPGSLSLTTGGATSLLPQFFTFPFPTVEIELTTQVAYTFKLQSIAGSINYTYQNAIVLIQGGDPVNNGTYKITQINADGTFIALPLNGLSNQVNEAFTGAQTITIFFAPNNEPAFQSTWYVVPMTGNQPVAGRFEYGIAYADWRIEGDSTAGPDLFPMSAASVYTTPFGTQFVLPYRAQNVTSAVTQITAAGAVDIGDATFSSTVGLKQFWLGNTSGQAYSNSGELLIPGPMASVFTASGFFEDNVNLSPEAPFLVSQSVASSGQLAITLGAVRIYVVVLEQTDENGNRIFSAPSPPLVVNMSGTNSVATIGGRLAFPLGSTGAPVANTFGPTCRNVTISIYATAFINGVPTTQHYKITSDLNVNGVAPVSGTNPSGFSFPDTFTWNYVDQNPDSQIQDNEILYTDKGYLPRYPAPAFSSGVGSWHNREWVIGYDGAIWMSGEKTEGDAIWFNPAFRYILPTDDEPIGIAAMEDYLIITCAQSVWYIPTAQFPDATGANGTLPTPVRLPFQNGSVAGFAQTIREGVAYDSTAGGLWLITRNLDNVWLSHDVLDTLATPIIGLALDKAQRLFVIQESGPIMVYDGIPAAWYTWDAPTSGVLISTYMGQACYQDAATVNVVVPGQVADVVAGVTYGIAPDITLAPMNPGNIRGLKRVWEIQAVGSWLGPHRLNAILSYPEDVNTPPTVYEPFPYLTAGAYVVPMNPLQEESSQYGLRLYADFVGISEPGLTFALELISIQVGMDQAVGLAKLPQGVTLTAQS